MNELKPNFDREGKQNFSLVRYILTLGGLSGGKGIMRWLLVALGEFASLTDCQDRNLFADDMQ